MKNVLMMKVKHAILLISITTSSVWGFSPGHSCRSALVPDFFSLGRYDFAVPDSAMSDFFLENYDWHPVFRSLAVDDSVPAMEFLLNPLLQQQLDGSSHVKSRTSLLFDESTTAPWKQLQAIPTDESDRQILAAMLDSMQKALLDIPCVSEEDDEFDAQFIEEGRRMLAVSRFQVLSRDCELFSTCWNELLELKRLDEPNTGSLIVLPQGYNLEQLDSFANANLLRPLEWLGLHLSFEVSSISHGNPALRLLHKLTPNGQ